MKRRALLAFFPLVVAYAAPPNDDRIHDEVLLRLSRDPDVKGGGMQIDVKDGIVTVKGVVDREKTKEKAEKLVKKIKGVKGVKNLIEVKPSGVPR